MNLNLGCGSNVPDGWVNVDYALGARFTKNPFFRILIKKTKLFNLDWNEKIYIHDLTKKFPWADSTVDVAYSSHTLEHLSKTEGKEFLAECSRVLKKNKIIRIVVPDLHFNVMEYLQGQIKADDFIEKLGVLYVRNKNRFKNKMAPFVQFPHKCMYDNERLIEILDEVGINASSREPFDSDIVDIRQIELESRTVNAAIVEGIKR